MVQRNFRKLKARKELKERRQGLYNNENEDELNLPEDTGRIKNHRIELQKTRDYVNNQYADTFHSKITEERKHDLLEEVKRRRRLVTEADLKEKNTTEIRLKFQDRYQEFEDNYGPQDDRRL